MKKLVLLSVLLSALPGLLHAQFNYTQVHNQQAHNLGAAQLPSLLGDDMRTGEIHLLNLYGGFANNFVSAYDLQQLSQSGKLSNAYIDNFLAKTPDQAALWAGLDLPIFNIFFNVNKKGGKPFLSFGLGMREKLDVNFTLNKDLLSLMYKGNKQFAGSTVNLSPSLNMLLYNEYFLAVAGQIKVPDLGKLKTITVKPAARFRMLNGMAGIYMPQANIDMYTDPEGRYIDFTTNLEANMSSAVDTPDFESALGDVDIQNFKSSGKGFGLDLGVGVSVLDRFRVHLGVTDMGSINFNRNAVNYTKNSSYRYEGVDLNGEGEVVNSGNLDELIQPEKTYNAFRMPLPTRLVLSGSYLMKKKTRRKVDYYKHNATFVYVQGFRNYLSATKTPALNLGYAYNLANMVNAGVNFTFGGLNRIMGGAHLGFRLGAVKLGVASNNLLPLISAKAGQGTDVNMYLGFYF